MERECGNRLFVLTYCIDSLDSSGQNNPYFSSANAGRQRQYVKRFALPSPYFPQAIVGGRHKMYGTNPKRLREAIKGHLGPLDRDYTLQFTASREGNKVRMRGDVSALECSRLVVVLAETPEPFGIENSGVANRFPRKLKIVRDIVVSSSIEEVELTIPPDSQHRQWEVFAFIQDSSPRDGRIMYEGRTRVE